MEKINRIDEKLREYNATQFFVFFAIAGITILFLALTAAYLFSKPQWTWAQFSFPKTFLISTIVLALSSYTMSKTVHHFKQDHFEKFKSFVKYTLILGFAFVLLQIAAWFQLNKAGIYLAGKPDGSYLYIISALHGLHLLLGVVLLVYLWLIAKYKLSDKVKRLIYFSDKTKLQRLNLIAIYWHFVDALWIYLLMFFLFNHL